MVFAIMRQTAKFVRGVDVTEYLISIDDIIIEGSPTQVRAMAWDERAVSDYTTVIEDLPPVDLFGPDEDGRYLIGDGYHRIQAAIAAGKTDIEAKLFDGGVFEAMCHGLRVNGRHGLRMTNAEKRAALVSVMRLPEASGLTVREISEIAGVSHQTVQRARAVLENQTEPSDIEIEVEPKTGVDTSSDRDTEEDQPKAGDGDEWYTPQSIIELAKRVVPSFDLDPATSEKANAVVGAAKIYTEADDGLTHPWHGAVWCNPPYSNAGAWVAKGIEEHLSGRAVHVFFLVNAKTETAFFDLLFEHSAICFVRGRIKFIDGRTGKVAQTGRTGSVVAYLGPRLDDFVRFFRLGDGEGLGRVVVPFGGSLHALKSKHKRLCAECGAPTSVGKWCPTCKQTVGREDRARLQQIRTELEVAAQKGPVNPQEVASKLRKDGVTTWHVVDEAAKLRIELNEPMSEWKQRAKLARGG